jgi:hypothetical protein
MKRSRSRMFFQAVAMRSSAKLNALDFNSRMARFGRWLHALELPNKLSAFVERMRKAAAPPLAALADVAGPRFKTHASAFRNSAGIQIRKLQDWCRHNFNEEMYGKTFVATATAATVLYAIARKMDAAQSWRHPGVLIIAFAGLLACALSLVLGTAVLLRSRARLRQDSAELVTSAVRWLQAPIGPAQFRDFSSANGKVNNERRAS